MSDRPYTDTRQGNGATHGRQYGYLDALSPMRTASAQDLHTISAVSVPKVAVDPEASQWGQSRQLTVPLNPQNIAMPRITEAGVKELRVRAQYDTERIAFLLEWKDPSPEVTVGTVYSFRDAVAIQFPGKGPGSPPFFCMGAPNDPVTIYQWKGDWQDGPTSDVNEAYVNMVVDEYPFSGKGPGEMAEATDYVKTGVKDFITAWAAGNPMANLDLQARTSVERLQAEGFGSLESAKEQDGQAKGLWRGGAWRVVISVPRKQPDFTFGSGASVPVAFAVWEGSRHESNGKKAYSLWNALTLP